MTDHQPQIEFYMRDLGSEPPMIIIIDEASYLFQDEDVPTIDECKGTLETLNALMRGARKSGVSVEQDRREQQVADVTFQGMGGTEALLRGPQREEDGPAAAEEYPVRGGR